MTVDYVDAGEAIDQGDLSGKHGTAPPVVEGVTYERILEARSEPENWLTYYGAYNGQRFSPLDQINTENVKRIGPAWVFQAGTSGMIAGASTYAFEAAPIVVDGIMFVSGWDGWVWALNAATGNEIWRYKHATPYDVSLCCGNVNRGVAVAKGKVFSVTPNAHLIALDASTGKKVWDRTYGDVRAGESATCAPLIVKNMVIVGSSGGEFGVRGHLDAFDLDSGEHQWRCYMVPKPGEPGSDTWPDGEAWTRGGGNCWLTGTFDPETNLLYWGTGNPAPDFDGEVREGDNLYTDSIVAVDADAGEIRWHYQCTPHDVWDYDSISECILFEHEGRKLLGHFDKNGYFFVVDRTDGELVRITPFVDRIDWGNITRDGKVTPSRYPEKEGEPVHFFPGPAGAKEWTHAAYSPETELFYVPVQDVGATATRRRREFKESIPYWGAGVQVDIDDMTGYVSAFDANGDEKWRWRGELPMCASVLATGGGLVFAGEPTGFYNALDARTGEHLWRFQCGSGHHSSPVTYGVDGRQFIAVPVGWGGWAEGFLPGMLGAGHGSALIVFALPE
ncbi:MAG: PQQ-dependent dehydrogenase, methanol/ethanol family [Pseudonocardia sp.]|uniref:PQQ-dependent dehydrogenase, methanol/ethanol family n=1 Tax=unclassified Pseudonocardia TaxID=2619320 RepID=UPI00086B093A|nr:MULTISPECIES: PQQ-dependent dehydrogenase, methanol/ethanol family [unclassified Pseudonocardia]MBN9112239.1 PQQ-dependent dehydrogenase, methanol/ethanol family [Pseudonocardia sp.]ODU30172.1 MAG: alcohol dehydrogenase [Pseudonocardia sp. SCN 72-51]ODV03098.1 MAG: alcohol dehydrogenase [Pseudonocardia sp. SCN 73-27]